MKSVNRGNAGPDAPADGNGQMPVIGGDDPYCDGEGPLPGGGGQEPARVPLRELMDDRVLDVLLERSKDAAGGLRLTGEGSMPGELVAAVLERALQAELTAHLGYDRHERSGGARSRSLPSWAARSRSSVIFPVIAPPPQMYRIT